MESNEVNGGITDSAASVLKRSRCGITARASGPISQKSNLKIQLQLKIIVMSVILLEQLIHTFYLHRYFERGLEPNFYNSSTLYHKALKRLQNGVHYKFRR